MKSLVEAIYSKYSHDTLPLSFHVVDANQSLPYCLFFFINSTPEYSFNSVSEETEIQFSVFAKTGSAVMEFMSDIKDIYDDCELTVAGYEFVKMERLITTSFQNDHDDGSWHGVVTYKTILHKEL